MQTRTILPLDEINRLEQEITSRQTVNQNGNREYKDRDELFDLIAFMLETAYINGVTNASEQINALLGFRFLDDTFDAGKMTETIELRLKDGKNWRDRVAEHLDNGDISKIRAVMESEATRDANTGSLDKAWDSGLELTKTWETMLDDRVRETHDYLEGVTIGIHDKFYSSSGDSAYAPGGFDTAEENVNCRCQLSYGMM